MPLIPNEPTNNYKSVPIFISDEKAKEYKQEQKDKKDAELFAYYVGLSQKYKSTDWYEVKSQIEFEKQKQLMEHKRKQDEWERTRAEREAAWEAAYDEKQESKAAYKRQMGAYASARKK